MLSNTEVIEISTSRIKSIAVISSYAVACVPYNSRIPLLVDYPSFRIQAW